MHVANLPLIIAVYFLCLSYNIAIICLVLTGTLSFQMELLNEKLLSQYKI